MSPSRRIGALGAIATMAVLVVGVPALLVVLVGNPWPGRTRVELRDEVALVVGVLAVLAWLVWLRFLVAVVAEVRDQFGELAGAPTAGFAPPPPARRGVGRLAQRLVAAALIVLPLAPRVTTAGAHTTDDVAPRRPDAPRLAGGLAATGAAAAGPGRRSVAVVPGDTLFGLARTHLGDAERWREIFELNRDRPQPDGGRLTSPSIIRPGWMLVLPAGPDTATEPTAFLASETVTIESGDDLWSLSHDRLRTCRCPHDDASVAGYVGSVVAANADVVEDPNLIHAGERFELPAIGTPPAPPPTTPPPSTTTLRAPDVDPPVIQDVRRGDHGGADDDDATTHRATSSPRHCQLLRPMCRTSDQPVRRRRSAWAGRPCCRRACSPCSPPAGGHACRARRARVLASPTRRPGRWQPSAACARSTPASGSPGSMWPSAPRRRHSSTRRRASP